MSLCQILLLRSHSDMYGSALVHVTVPDSATALALLNELDGAVKDFQVVQGSMDDVFLNLANGEKSL